MTILVCLNCSERQSHQGKWWSYISLSNSFLSPYASRFTRWCRTLRVSDDALFLSDYSCLFSCLLGRVIKVMMINLFLCLTLFSTYASRGPTRETSVFQWGSIHHLLSNSSFSMTYVMILFLSDYYCLFMLQGKAEDIISQGSQGQGPSQVYNQGTRWSEDFLLGPRSGHGCCWGS